MFRDGMHGANPFALNRYSSGLKTQHHWQTTSLTTRHLMVLVHIHDIIQESGASDIAGNIWTRPPSKVSEKLLTISAGIIHLSFDSSLSNDLGSPHSHGTAPRKTTPVQLPCRALLVTCLASEIDTEVTF